MLVFQIYNQQGCAYYLFLPQQDCQIPLFLYSLSHPKMTHPQDYERLLNDLQLTKKSLTMEKVSHQSTLTQLEQSYNLNIELQEVIKSQATTVASLNRQLNERGHKLAQMSENYEIQLREVKDFVHVKERELQGIRGALAVTDYDMVRLRVIGELELTHRQAIEEVEKQKDRFEKLWSDEKQMKILIAEKYQLLKKELEDETAKASLEKEEYEKKHIRQINKIQQKLQMVSKNNRQLEKSLQTHQKRYQSLQQKYQIQINKVYEQMKPTANLVYHGQPQTQSRRVSHLEASLEQKNLEIESMKKRIKNYEVKISQISEDFEKKLKSISEESISQEEYMKKMNEKDKEHEQIIKGYEKRIRSMNESHLDEMKQIKKQNQRKLWEVRDKLRKQKQNLEQNYNVGSGISRIEIHQEQRQKETGRYEEQIDKLEKENEKLKRELSKKEKEKGRTEREKSEEGSIQQYKMKLSEANKQIVNLLLEKVNMKQQLSKLKP